MSCTIYNIKDKKPNFKDTVIAYVTSLENVEYWTDYPVFDTTKICK
jgi:hypothetical protein